MSRRVHKPVPVEVDPGNKPVSFSWHGVDYRVRVVSDWLLQDRWWSPSGFSKRHYYRVVTADHQVFDLYYDDAPNVPFWVLDVIHD